MQTKQKLITVFTGSLFLILLAACTAEVGSKGWCEDMKEKVAAAANGEENVGMTMEDMQNYALNCPITIQR